MYETIGEYTALALALRRAFYGVNVSVIRAAQVESTGLVGLSRNAAIIDSEHFDASLPTADLLLLVARRNQSELVIVPAEPRVAFCRLSQRSLASAPHRGVQRQS